MSLNQSSVFDNYDAISNFYDSWASLDQDYEASKQFYLELSKKCSGTLLELGIGNGRIGLEIAKRGIPFEGLDLSENMLDICREKMKAHELNDNIKLHLASFADFKLDCKFNQIILPFRTIGHLLTHEERVLALRNIYDHLEDGGIFAFDHYIYKEHMFDGQSEELSLIHSEFIDDEKHELWDKMSYDKETKKISFYNENRIYNSGHQIRENNKSLINFSWLDPEEIQVLLNESGFNHYKVYGDFDLSPFDVNSNNQVYVCWKKIR